MSDTTVYITRTGNKYHHSSCRYLGRSSIPISLKDAVSRGYGICTDCNPPIYKPAPAALPVINHEEKIIQENDKKTEEQHITATVQCSGITKKGKRCKQLTNSTNGKCFQHNQ